MPRRYKSTFLCSTLLLAMAPAVASAAPLWFDNGTFVDPNVNDYTHHVELEDIDSDGDVDIILVNNVSENIGNGGSVQLNRVYLNDGGTFTEDPTVFQTPDNVRVVKLRDVDGDGNADIVAGATWSGNSYIMLGDGNGAFTPGGSAPEGVRVGSLDLADVDNDDDLDIVVSNYGPKQELGGVDDPGAPLQLWLNDGSGNFSNSGLLPTDMGSHVAYSWSVNFVDVDNDFDFDIVASSAGGGTDTPQDLDTFPQTRVFVNDNGSWSEYDNLEFAPLKICRGISFADFNNDLYLDAFTLQDGGLLNDEARRDRVMMNDPDNGGAFANDPMFLSIMDNPQALHRVGQIFDFNHDRQPDVVVAGLQAPLVNPYELLRNDGTQLSLDEKPFELPELEFVSSTAIADLNGDYIDDIVVGQFEVGNNNYVLTGTDDLGADAGAPVIGVWEQLGSAMVGETVGIRARIHDNKNPTKAHDWLLEGNTRKMPYIEYILNLPDEPTVEEFNTFSDNDETTQVATVWTGEYMHKGSFVVPLADTLAYRFCAIDHANNRTCAPPYWLEVDQAICGDQILTEPEECDDNTPECIDCLICGNGICSPGEECPEDCAECGNDVVDPGEECDDNGDPNCIECLVCGNGVCSPGEMCPEDCGECGDGVVNMNEECDDPNDPNCLGCFVCGNGVCSVGEEEFCPEDCGTGPVCGDGMIEPPEECDDPNDSNCNLCQVCGNGICSAIEMENNLCPEDCNGGESESASETDTDMCDSAGADPETCLDDDGCGCVASDNYNNAWYSLALFGLLGLRRVRRRK